MNKSTRHKMRIGVIIATIILSVLSFIEINYQDLTWETNSSSYRQLLTGLLLMLSMIISIYADSKKNKR